MRFGALLRELREQRDVSMASVAREVGVGEAYYGEVERGTRRPMADYRTVKAACFLEVDPMPLLVAAGRDRGTFTVPVTSDERDELAAAIAIRWVRMAPAQVAQIRKVLGL